MMTMGLAIGLPMAFQPLTLAVESEEILSPELAPQLVVVGEIPQVPDIGKASQYLPGRAAVHLVLRIGERRVYVYRGEEILASYPVAVGKEGWETPTGDFEVINMEVDPVFLSLWTGNKIGPGPDNPLGPRWIGFWTDNKTQVGFHGTNYPELIGQAVSHGCVRMHNKDVLALYEQVELGTKVIVEQ
ncbi:L,D-transpeptidase [Roseofilum casamattae]|uniref:L,D-transpeptidase n=1 Tax=Roseofilum casamattae BLCC-M143 TaxID=3022442 RepID=A0ABT7BWX0_9CYAN|nr:L,D-transpeptidase [Roseofilum casamattae]MDJ1183690.1 L,D-transpeptidase [Roseofilum casamattae BLCC-M143]